VNKVILVILAIIMLLPVWFLATGSLSDIRGVMVMPPKLIPPRASLDNYAYFLSLPLARWVLNTVIIALGTALVSVMVSCSAGYAFAFFNFPLKKWLWLALLAGVMIPRMSVTIPAFVVMRKLGMLSTYHGLILSRALSPMGMYLARVYFQTIPMSLLDAARIDGASEFQTLARIVMPISRPIVTCLALFAGSKALGDYVWQSLVIRQDELRTLLIGLLQAVSIQNNGNLDFMLNPLGRKFAASMLLLLPLLLIFVVASKYFTSAMGGAIKE